MIYSHSYKNDQNMVLLELYYRQMHTMVVRIGNYFQRNVDESPVEIFEQNTFHWNAFLFKEIFSKSNKTTISDVNDMSHLIQLEFM